jgi:preprotein translocase subunit SecB
MSDANAAAAAPGGQDVPYQITIQYIKDFSFESPRAPQIFGPAAGVPQIQVGVGVSANKLGDTMYEVVLDLRAEAKKDDVSLFVTELTYGGVVVIDAKAPQEHIAPLLLIDVPRQLFPFARAILSNVSREGGFPSLMLSAVDFVALYQHRIAEAEAAAKAAAPGVEKTA